MTMTKYSNSNRENTQAQNLFESNFSCANLSKNFAHAAVAVCAFLFSFLAGAVISTSIFAAIIISIIIISAIIISGIIIRFNNTALREKRKALDF